MGFAAKEFAATLAGVAALALAQAATAEPEVIVKCDGPLPQGMKFTNADKWRPYPNPDHAVTITRDNGKFAIQLEGEGAYASNAVFAMPMQNIKIFKVLRSDGAEQFHLEKGEGGKPILKHTIRGGRDGTGKYNIRETILANCSTVAPDVVVGEPQAAGAGG